MVTWLRRRWEWVLLSHRAKRVVLEGKGFAAQVWPWSLDLTTEERVLRKAEIHAWLTRQVSASAAPYGRSELNVGLALAQVARAEREAVWLELGPTFSRMQAHAGITTALAAVDHVPVDTYPQANQLEVYVMSMGDIFRHATHA